jgi:hypothetical protein
LHFILDADRVNWQQVTYMPTALGTDEAFFALGSIALLAIFRLRQLPDYKPGEVPCDKPEGTGEEKLV